MPRILVRAHKNPFTVADAEETFARNLIGNNTGNLVFAQAVYRLLSTPDAELATSRLIRDSPESLDEEVDHLVIPLANAFRPEFVDHLDAMSRLVEQLHIPVSVLGVGAQATLEGAQKRGSVVDAATTRFVRAVLEHSPSIGVRGEFTRQYLRGLGFGDEHVHVIGCPSLFMYGPHLDVRRKVDEITPDSPVAFNASPYVHEVGPLSQYCAEHYPRLVYMSQNIQSLELLLYGTYPMRRRTLVDVGAPVTLEHPLVREGRVRFFLDPSTWFEHLRGYDFSFGTRIHGNIAALLAGVPAVLLAHDSRTLELAEYHEIPYRLVTDVVADTDPAALHAEASWERLTAGHAARWDTFAAFLAEHGLPHLYLEGQQDPGFDEQLAATAFPPPVEPLTGPDREQRYASRRHARDLDQLRAQLARTEQKLAKSQQQLVRTRSRLESTEEKLATAKAAVARYRHRIHPPPTAPLPVRAWSKVDRTVRRLGRRR